MDNKSCVKLQFFSDINRVRDIVLKLLDFIDQHSPSNEARSDLRLVLNELLYNAVIHGNKKDPQKRVYVRINVEGTVLHAQIQDEGLGFNFPQAIEYAKTEEALFYENNRGVILVSGLTDNLSFNETGNIIRFEKRLK